MTAAVPGTICPLEAVLTGGASTRRVATDREKRSDLWSWHHLRHGLGRRCAFSRRSDLLAGDDGLLVFRDILPYEGARTSYDPDVSVAKRSSDHQDEQGTAVHCRVGRQHTAADHTNHEPTASPVRAMRVDAREDFSRSVLPNGLANRSGWYSDAARFSRGGSNVKRLD